MKLDKFAPDVVVTVKRFPFAVFLTVLATIILIGLSSEIIADGDETMLRLLVGLASAAIFALAGSMFSESKRGTPLIGAVLTYFVPLLVIAALQVRTFEWIMPVPLVAVGFLWLSVAPFTRIETGDARETAQNQFWWINHRAVATGILAVAGFVIIAVGLIAIERSMSLLFGVSSDRLFYGYLLPFTGMFLTPLYWFSTIPRLDEFKPAELIEPDFISRAIGFLGQFVMVPLLLAYSLILVAYAVQIVFSASLPRGTIGWMVLGYLVTGAATTLVLHPPFMRDKQIVRLFRNFWFWLTIVPLILYGAAVFIRVDAYGLTPERVLLIAGGLWAALLTLAFLVRRFADIRLIPALAGVVLLLISVGPWNFENLAVSNQISRVTHAMDAASWSVDNNSPEWSQDQARQVRSAFSFLFSNDTGHAKLKDVLFQRGLSESEWEESDRRNAEFFNLPPDNDNTNFGGVNIGRAQPGEPVLLMNTNIFVGDIHASNGNSAVYGAFTVTLEANQLIISVDDVELARADLLQWLEGQDSQAGMISQPALRLASPEGNFSIIVGYANFGEENGQLLAANLSGMLFTDRLP